MKFQELHEHIPYARFGKEKSLTMQPYDNITLALPGRHAEDCSPKGGDFVVMVTDKDVGWKRHQFTHTDIFVDIEHRVLSSAIKASDFMEFYLEVIATGADPTTCKFGHSGIGGVMNPLTFFCATQCLAVAEHRRYSQYEKKFGGRFLPFRFAAGIAEGLWTATDAAEKQKRGRPGVEWLEKDHGIPVLTKQLMGK